MTSRGTAARPGAGPPTRGLADDRGALSLEAVMLLPLLALLVVGLLLTAGVIRDVLLVHEAARAGARAAATTSGAPPVVTAARTAAPELELQVVVEPTTRRDGDLARVTVTTRRRVGPVDHRISAQAVARVEPAVGTMPRASTVP